MNHNILLVVIMKNLLFIIIMIVIVCAYDTGLFFVCSFGNTFRIHKRSSSSSSSSSSKTISSKTISSHLLSSSFSLFTSSLSYPSSHTTKYIAGTKRCSNKRWRINIMSLQQQQQQYDNNEQQYDVIDNEIQEPKRNMQAFTHQTPHSGRHFIPSHPKYNHNNNNQQRKRSWMNRIRQKVFSKKKRFMEGWYYRLTIPNNNVSFAIIISIEDPAYDPSSLSPIRLVCVQIIGPNDEYLIRGSRDTTIFWAWKYQQGLGATFQYNNNNNNNNNNITDHMNDDMTKYKQQTALSKEEWYRRVQDGFQILPNSFLGSIRGYDGTRKGNDYYITDDVNSNNNNTFDDTAMKCQFDFTIDPVCGWGGTKQNEQKSTGGWLSYYPIFEPHWQVTLADALASGTIIWNNITYTFTNASFYSEKNWGNSLPQKWYWTQCNTFHNYKQLSVVAGGGIRKIPIWNIEETLGMVSIHYNNTFYEAVPWMGEMEWNVSTWGYWYFYGTNTLCDQPFEVEVVYTIDDPVGTTPGLIFRAPTPKDGMIRFCRDTFHANTVVTLWELQWDSNLSQFVRKDGPPIIDRATSTQGGAEIGGAPWWDDWTGEAKLRKPIKALLQLPFRLDRIKRKIKRKLSR